MDNYQKNKLQNTQWNNLYTPIYKEDNDKDDKNTDDTTEAQPRKQRIIVFSPVLTIQLVFCVTIIILLFFCKAFLTEKYNTFMDSYNKELTSSMYFSGDFSDFDYSSLFSASDDEV